jgi:hypothetical protein
MQNANYFAYKVLFLMGKETKIDDLFKWIIFLPIMIRLSLQGQWIMDRAYGSYMEKIAVFVAQTLLAV